MKNLITILSFLSFFLSLNAQKLKTSSPLELSIMKNQFSFEDNLGFSNDELPSSYSLEKFCPKPRTQSGQSCVGWAVAYSAASTIYNYENNIISSNEKIVNVFDPYYVYSSIKSDDVNCLGADCDCGTYLWEALDLIVNYGLKKQYVTPKLDCSSTLTKNHLRTLVDRTANYAIDEYAQLIDYKELPNGKFEKIVDVDLLKYALTINLPIVSGIGVGDQFGKLGSENSLYRPTLDEVGGGHAITIIGYDDYKFGGSFRIINSYGSDWGDAGFFWMTYDDFEEAVGDAYIFINEDWNTWSKDFYRGSYYKGKFSDNNKKRWEGGINSENNLFHGQGIFMTDGFSGFGKYNNGYKHGWWICLDHDLVEDPFYGWVLFDNGEIIESEELGFSSQTMEEKESIIKSFHLDNIGYKLSTESVNSDNFTIQQIESMKIKSSAVKE